MVKALLWWLSALTMSYFLLILGVHKFSYKLGKLELHEPLYKRLDEFYLRSVEHISVHMAEQLEKAQVAMAHGDGGRAVTVAPIKLPHASPKAVKQTIGLMQMGLALLWFTKRWRLAAFGSCVIMLSWLLIAQQSFFWTPEDVPFAGLLLGISLLSFVVGPSVRESRKGYVAKKG